MADEAEKLTSGQLYELVVVGSSAGGIEALSTLISTLPRDFPLPIVIAQHLDPARLSHLGEILQRESALPVRTVDDHEALKPGVVFVAPADRHVQIVDHTVFLHRDGRARPKPSINLLFSSAAAAYGEGLIGVVLTGNGADGAEGARDVKQAGGTIIIQNPGTAMYPMMPESLDPATVDIVADIERMGPTLSDLVSGARALTQPPHVRTLETFLREVREQTGVDFTSYKTPTIMRRLQRRIAATNTDDLAHYIIYLRSHPVEYQRLISTFLIKVTEFFRDPELFAYLRDTMLPELIDVARTRGNELRLWSAGCATGEEAYSLAVLVADALGDELDRFNVRIFATDLDEEAISFARRGVYLPAALAAMPQDLIERYFTLVDGEYVVKKRVRALTVFGQHDLAQRAPFPRIDLTLCRNVLIYFTAELQKRALNLFAYSLRDGGYLVLGKAETTSPLVEFFQPVAPHLKIYRRHGDRMALPVERIRDTTPVLPSQVLSTRRQLARVDLMRSMQGIAQPRTTLTRLGDIMQGLPLGIVVVDRRYDIQAINTAAHRLLGIHRAAIGEDLIHLVENLPAQALRAMIDAAFRGATPANMGDIVTVETVIGEQRYLHVECYPQSIAADDDSAEWVSVLVNDITENVHARLASDESYQAERRRLEERSAQQQDEIARFTTQIQRLAELNRELFEANEELTSANMELHSSNEEFLVSSEEVQAASEEVETLNEELQATNEELETLNEELQATVEELNTTNADLQARSLELQDLATSLEQQRQTVDAERSRLAAILVSMGDAVLVVDNDGNLALTNTAYERMFGVTSASFSAQDAEGHPLDVRSALLERVANGEAFSLEFTRIAPDGSRRWFEAKGQPADGVKDVRGVIIIRDITERSMRRLQDQFLALASHELRTPLTSIQGSLQLLEKALSGGKISERSIHYAQSAARQVKRLGRLVDDLVDVSRLNNGRLNLQLHPVNLAQIVRQTVETFEMERAQPKGPTPSVRIVGDTDPLMVNGDATRIEQILQNLLTNALKYAPTSESIDVQLRRVGREAELQVKDYGAGIPEVDVPHLFSRFYQVSRGDRASQSGLGLGLFIVKELVNAHGGSIAVTSEVGVGTTFTLRLPLLQEIEGSTGF